MLKIVVLDTSAVAQKDLNFDLLLPFGNCEFFDHTPAELVVDRIFDADIVLTNKTVIDKDILDKCTKLKMISVLATGYNVVDCDYAKKRGIVVCNVPSYSTDSVAQHTFALILEICVQVGKHDTAVKNGQWVTADDFCFCLTEIMELNSKTLGIIGYGNIGKAVQKIANAFGMKVLYHNRSHVEGNSSLHEVLKNSDIISLHCPLTEENKQMINKETIALMKKSAIIINTSRGGLIHESDLASALNVGRIAAFGTDVLSEEPPKDTNPLLHAKNTVITPHIAWASTEARSRLLDITKNNIASFIAGSPINVVN